MAIANTPTLSADTRIVPAVKVVFTGMTGWTTNHVFYVWRTSGGVTEAVRGANGVAMTSGDLTVYDYDAPFGVVSSYTGEARLAGVSDGVGPAATTTLTSSSIWIHDPLAPAVNLEIALTGTGNAVLGQGSFGSVKRGYEVVRTSVLGKARPVVQFYGQKAIEGLNFDIIATTIGSTALENILATSPILVRFPTEFHNLPARLNGTLEAVQEPLTWHTDAEDITRWKLVLDETEAQSLDIVFTVYSYSYWSARYATYTAASAVYGASTYDYAVNNPPA